MKLNFFGREVILKKEAVVIGTAVLLLLGCLAGFIFLRDDNAVIIESGGGPVSSTTTGKAVNLAPDGTSAASGGTPVGTVDSLPLNKGSLQTEETIYVYVVGCVRHPGIVTIKKGQLVNDAVKAAGGLTSDADADNVNLVFSLNENVMLNIKSKPKPEQVQTGILKKAPAEVLTAAEKQMPDDKRTSEKQAAAGLGTGAEIVSESGSGAAISAGSINESTAPTAEGARSLVNINTAGADELDTLPGVGEATAKDIIAFREKNGKFNKIEDIMKVPRIKQNRFDNIKDYITVD